MRRYLAVGVVLAFAFGGLDTAEAQGRSGSGDSDPFSFHLGPIAEGTDIRIEVDSISTRGGPDPGNTDQANHNIDYKARHVFSGFAMGIHLEPPALAGFELDADFLLGSMSTALSENIHNMSVHEPGPGNDEEHNTSLDEADLAVGIQLRAWYRLQQVKQIRLWAGAEYQFLTGWAHFNDERFFDDDIEGDYSFSRHRLTFFVGTRIGIIRPYLGFGFLIYDANLDVEEADKNNPDKWDADFNAEDLIVIRLGAEVSSGPLAGRLDVYLLGEWGMGVSLVIKI